MYVCIYIKLKVVHTFYTCFRRNTITMGTPEAPKPRKSFLQLKSTMKRKRTDNLQGKKYRETEVKCSLFNMINHSVSRELEYLLEDEDNSIKFLAQEECDNIYVICKVGGDGQSDQSEFQNAATKKRGMDDSTVYIIVFVLLEVRSGKKILWKNCNPNSPDATCHLMFCFAKETASFI